MVTLVRGNTYKSALLGQPGPVLLGLASIQRDGGFRADSLKTYGGESAEKLLLRPGDLYVSLKDVTQSGDLLGSVARVPHSVPLGRVTQDTVKLQFDARRYPADLLYWTLRAPEYRAYCRERAIGTTNLSLSRDDFLAFRLPPATAQRCSLVELLETIEHRIDVLRQINATLESIAQALFKSWFIDFDPVRAKAEGSEPEGMDSETAALFPDSFEDSALGEIPKGWRPGTFGEVASNPRSQAKPGQMPSSTPYVGLEHMPRKSISLDRLGTAEGLESGKFWFEQYDVLFGKLRPYFHKVGVAPCRGVCSTDILVIRPRGPNWLGYVVMHASSDELIAHTTLLSNGARMPRTSWHDIDAYKVVLPDERCATAFNDVARPFFERIFSNMAAMDTLSELRDTLLPRLISGKLRLLEAEAQVSEALA
ncbi:restriction endonuclease subunit S [Burkholderia vietnamiensis]|uniref:restriction endonuclease subunit S n=1 Tax=Burkholderia vietnamiensis TaxID=60552 RepID=UPI001B990723|nr:restriction endonuclease subunit S [Burkholderia vietnamiensis]MBR7918799.1 restriction endonuclease subunit S [Burkholderia vietnamiensis]